MPQLLSLGETQSALLRRVFAIRSVVWAIYLGVCVWLGVRRAWHNRRCGTCVLLCHRVTNRFKGNFDGSVLRLHACSMSIKPLWMLVSTESIIDRYETCV